MGLVQVEVVFKGERFHAWAEHLVDVAIEPQGPVHRFRVDLNDLFVGRFVRYFQGVKVSGRQVKSVGFSAVALQRCPQGVVLVNADAESFSNDGTFDQRSNDEFQLRTFIGFAHQLLRPSWTSRDREHAWSGGIQGG